jgi:hypothetical protein
MVVGCWRSRCEASRCFSGHTCCLRHVGPSDSCLLAMLNIFCWLRCYRNAAIRVLCYPAVTVFSMGTLRIGIAGERTDAIHVTGASKNIPRMQLSLAEYLLVVAVVSEFALISTSYDSLQQAADIGYWLSRSVAIRYFSGHPCMLPWTYRTIQWLHLSVAEYLLVVTVQSQCSILGSIFTLV